MTRPQFSSISIAYKEARCYFCSACEKALEEFTDKFIMNYILYNYIDV